VAARSAAEATVGVLTVRQALVRLRHLPGAPGRALVEAAEVRAARRRLDEPPKATVVTVIPTFGRGELLEAAVASALGQTLSDHAVVVVVDGGPQPALSPHPRLHVVRLAAHRGVPGLVRNVGVRVSDSPYLAFLDDDNTWEPDHLAASLQAHRRGAELTYTGLRQVRPDGTIGEVIAVEFDRRALRSTSYVDTSTVVVRRSRRVRFSRVPRGRGAVYEDWWLARRLSRRLRTELVPRVTVNYLVHPEGYMQRQG
jgi:glycosyltransferase involved in cell wall biosynthesis